MLFSIIYPDGSVGIITAGIIRKCYNRCGGGNAVCRIAPEIVYIAVAAVFQYPVRY